MKNEMKFEHKKGNCSGQFIPVEWEEITIVDQQPIKRIVTKVLMCTACGNEIKRLNEL